MIMLSILIPTIPERSNEFDVLFNKLTEQKTECERLHDSLEEVEIIYATGLRHDQGGVTVGAKRNSLVEQAQGKYLCFVDDDDNIPGNYVESLLRLCQNDADIITFKQLLKTDFYWSIVNFNIAHEENEEATPEQEIKRRPFHVCPIRSEIAKKYLFPDKNNAEDWAWMEQVLSEVVTQSHSNLILHEYNHSSVHSAVDQIERNEV